MSPTSNLSPALRRATLALFFFGSIHATAAAAEQFCSAIASGIKSAYMADNGEVKYAALKADNRYCRRKRVSLLSRSYRALNEAADSGEPKKIILAAKRLDANVNASNMMMSCYGTMLEHAKLVRKATRDSLRTLTVGACK